MPNIRACIKEGPGKVSFAEIALPDPGPGQALIRTTLTTICGSDIHIVDEFDQMRPAAGVAPVIERQVARDAKDPGPQCVRRDVRHRPARNPEEHLLRQVRRLALADNPAQIAEHAIAMGREEHLRVHSRLIPAPNNTGGAESSHEHGRGDSPEFGARARSGIQ